MANDDWQKAKDIFNAAVDLPQNERPAYLDRSCLDDAGLRANVEELLANYKTSFLEFDNEEDSGSGVGARLRPHDKLKHHEIIRLLGVGGMGEVYLAQDTLLDRKVAIKLLNARYEGDQSNTQRFIREAKAASALNHPNILTIHEIGETAGSHYIVSEFVDGKTLREIIASRRLNLSEVIEISIQIASALSAAHAARIIHRDIKPENIVVRDDGYVKVLDFGLAKLMPQQPSLIGLEDETIRRNQTAEGLILGTVSYMSPEQASGKPVDERTDIFSLGVLIYEMVTGRTPFEADSISEKFANLINKEPPPLARYAEECPPELQRIVSKTLSKDPDERYQTVKGLLADLKPLKQQTTAKPYQTSPPESNKETAILTRTTGDVPRPAAETGESTRWYRGSFAKRAVVGALLIALAAAAAWYFNRPTAPAQPSIKSLAVLPLKSLDSGENFLGLGIADTLIRKISQTGKVIVRPTSAVRRFLTEDTDAVEAAKQLNTDAVLEGNVQRADDRLRVSVNLLRTSDGASLWTDSFDMPSGDIFTIQDTVAQQVVTRLRLQLDMDQSARLNKHATSNPVAYDYYVKGLYSFDQRTWGPTAKPQAEATAELFKSAIAADPDFALAHAQLANIYAWTATLIAPEDQSLFDRAEQEIMRADALDAKLAETHIARMTLLMSSRSSYQYEAAIREGLAAEAIDPNVGPTSLADAYYHLGLEQQAEREYNKAFQTDPTSQFIQNEYVLFLNNYRRYDEMAAAARKYFPADPVFSDYFLGKGDLDNALKAAEQEAKDYPDNPWTYGVKAIVLAKKGDLAGADASVRAAIKLLRPLELTYHHMTYQIACAYSVMGKKDEAIRWLRETAGTGFPVYPVMARDAFLDPLRKEPEFIQFMTDMKALHEKYESEFP